MGGFLKRNPPLLFLDILAFRYILTVVDTSIYMRQGGKFEETNCRAVYRITRFLAGARKGPAVYA